MMLCEFAIMLILSFVCTLFDLSITPKSYHNGSVISKQQDQSHDLCIIWTTHKTDNQMQYKHKKMHL